MKQKNIKTKIANFAFVGVLGLNMIRPAAPLAKDASATGRPAERLMNQVEKRAGVANTMRAQLKNVKVTAVSESSLTVDNAGTSVTVNLASQTGLRRKFGGKSEIDEFSVGNMVSVIGRWTDDTKTAINAVLVRNESIQKRHGTFFGTVKSVSDTGFVINSIYREEQTVTVGSAKIINRRGEVISLTDIKVGDKVRVKGLWDASNKTVTEVREVKDFSLPPMPSRSPSADKSPSATP